MVEAVVLLPRQRQAKITAAGAKALAGVPVVDAALAAGVLQAGALAICWTAGGDADDPGQGIGAITDGVRPAKHLDALDVFDGQGQVRPVHGGQAGPVDRAAVDQHLQAAGLADAAAVIVDRAQVALGVADHHPRHQAHQFGNVARAGGLDQLPIEHRDAARHRRRGLLEPGSGEHLGQLFAVKKQVGSLPGRAGEQAGQQGWQGETADNGHWQSSRAGQNCGILTECTAVVCDEKAFSQDHR
ncbi:hypothetical protein D3C81_1216550 [compost metagenome]